MANLDFGTIIQMESGGRQAAKSKAGAIGLAQVLPGGAIADYAHHVDPNVTVEAVKKDRRLNLKIGLWYMAQRIPAMLKNNKLPDTLENRLAAYNAGIGKLVATNGDLSKLPKETKRYIKTYKRLTTAKSKEKLRRENGR